MIKEAWQGLVDFVQEINTTSTRILVSLILSTITVLTVLTLMVLQIKIEIAVLGAVFAFLVSLGGLDVVQYSQKRKTFIPDSTDDTTISADTVANRAIGSEHGIEFTP